MALIDKVALMGYLQPLTGLLVTSVIWENDPNPFVSPTDNAIVKFKITSYGGRGIDDVIRTYTGPAGSDPAFLTTVQQGLRSFNLQVKAETYNKSSEAVEVLETLRMALRNLENINTLNGLGISLFNIGDTLDLPTHYDNRVVSAAIMTVYMGATNTYTQAPSLDGWVDTVNTDDFVPGDFS